MQWEGAGRGRERGEGCVGRGETEVGFSAGCIMPYSWQLARGDFPKILLVDYLDLEHPLQDDLHWLFLVYKVWK